jgi:hypothetical protein
MKRERPSIRQVLFTLALFSLPFIVSSAWLGDTADTLLADVGTRINPLYTQRPDLDLRREFLVPETPQAEWPKVSYIDTRFDRDAGHVVIRWEGAVNLPAGSRYAVYRGIRMLSSVTALGLAERISPLLDSSVVEYFDRNAPVGDFYYAVTIVDQNNYEYFRPELDQTYTFDPVRVPVAAEREAVLPALVRGIQARYEADEDVLRLSWEYSNIEIPGLVIYHAGTLALLNENILRQQAAHRVAPGSRETEFLIRLPEAGEHFFTIYSFNNEGQTNSHALPGENSLAQAVIVPPRQGVQESPLGQPVNVWRTNFIDVFITNQRPVHIYRTNETTVFLTNRQPVNLVVTNTVTRFVTNEQICANQVSPMDFTFTNQTFITNDRFVTNTHFITNFIVSHHYITNHQFITNHHVINIHNTIPNTPSGTVVQGERAREPFFNEEDSAKLREEIRRFYGNRESNNRAGLRTNVENLHRLQMTTRSPDVALQSTLFLGQVYFHLGEYTNAFREFVKLRESMPDESSGWINRCVERMR